MYKRSAWIELDRFEDPAVPKLFNLRRAQAAGLRVPPTWWILARDAGCEGALRLPKTLPRGPFIVRSGSPTEDTPSSSNAGRFVSRVVRAPEERGAALACVTDALPRDSSGKPRGVVFLQPFIEAGEAGVAFFDGFYYERAAAAGSNEALTSGQDRGIVQRGGLKRGDPWSEWLTKVFGVFGGHGAIDIEYVRDAVGFLLLQVRPALFAVNRNRRLSLANHKEILGEVPSPWILSAVIDAAREVPRYFAEIDPVIEKWDEVYALELAERPWMNFSFFDRLMDHWGLPRTIITAAVGGEPETPSDGEWRLSRLIPSLPQLLRLTLKGVRTFSRIPVTLDEMDRSIRSAVDLPALHHATVTCLVAGIRSNFAIGNVLAGTSLMRQRFGTATSTRVVTREMMEAYARLAERQNLDARREAFDDWIHRYGHRGPLESDLARPRFAELRQALWEDLKMQPAPPVSPPDNHPSASQPLWKWFHQLEERREWFRDEMMRRWQRLRLRILAEAEQWVAEGRLDQPDDVFWLRGTELSEPGPLQERVRAAKARVSAAQALQFPLTSTHDEILALLQQSGPAEVEGAGEAVFSGVSLCAMSVEGRAVKADDLVTFLQDLAENPDQLGVDAILVTPSLEPSWAIIFPRVIGVVAEIGGELSHASILLREARKPAIVNCAGIYGRVTTGDRLRLDGARGLVFRLEPCGAEGSTPRTAQTTPE